MEFLSLEVQGFKSFMERARFEFKPGITAIVGPNGCGKSNIMDALRWVLGEQSVKNLRGERMEDIIFNGTNHHKSLGMAEVSLKVKSNGSLPIDYDEVSISRRLFRSGDSEYSLNKTPCRLKDISELFLDTGVGYKAYSMVSQGRVDFLLSSKPADRRMLIEEAAGIMKYKQRKKEALNKMELAKQNLLRVSDIIGEIKRQRDKLNRQAKAALRYKDLLQKERELALFLAGYEYLKLQQSWQEVIIQLQELQEQETTQLIRLGSSEANLEELRLVIMQWREELSKLKQQVYEQELQAKRSEDRIGHLKETVSALDEQQAAAQREIEQTTAEQKSAAQQLANQQLTLEAYEQEHQSKQIQLETEEQLFQKQEAGYNQKQQVLEQEKTGMIDLAAAGARFRNMLSSSETREREITGKQHRLAAEIKQAEAEKDTIQQKISTLDACIRDTQHKHNQLQQQTQRLQTELTAESQLLKQEEVELGKLREQLGLKSSKLYSLRELNQNLEGFEAGVRNLMQAKELPDAGLTGVHQAIGQLIKTEAHYETAIEAALNHRLGYIVVDDLAMANKAIEYLKQHKAGRTSFILKDSLNKDKAPLNGLNGQPGVIGPAPEFLNYAAANAEVVEFALGNVLLVEDLATAGKLFSEKLKGWTIATLAGEVLEPEGIISGGGTEAGGNGILARNRRIEELQSEVAGLNKQHKALAQRVENRLIHIAGLSEAQDDQQNWLRKTEFELMHQKKDAEQQQYELTRIRKQLETIGLESDQLKLELEEIKAQATKLEQELSRLQEQEQAKQAIIDKLKQQLTASEQELQSLRQKVVQHRVDMASLEEKKKATRLDIERLKESINKLGLQLNERKLQVEKHHRRKQQLAAEITQTQAALAELAVENEALKRDCNQKEQAYQAQASQLEQAEQQSRQQKRALEELRQRLTQVELEITKAQLRLDQLAEQITRQFSLPLDQALEKIKQTDGNPEQWTEQHDKLSTRLSAMGDVNLTAIEEYKLLQERYEFLNTQKEDSLQSIDSLHKVITSINATTRDKFKQTFEAVNEHFTKVYARLFEGGKAELRLEEGLNLLEAGVEILVQPPGKKLQNLGLLSGGERALTAIAFLFAIYLIKPSPICFLDEVDAALDDLNVGRLLKMLREFTERSQFVLITHNKRTMEVADMMYGITMETPGVSKIVSVKFNGNGNGNGNGKAKPSAQNSIQAPKI